MVQNRPYPFSTNCVLEKDHGFSTGTAATAAALAAFMVLQGNELLNPLPTPLPNTAVRMQEERRCLSIPIAYARKEQDTGTACVIKDGGTDPDATHKTRIVAHVRKTAAAPADLLPIELSGGQGIGQVTLPGLPVAVGEPAINPVPRAQIISALRALCVYYQYQGGLQVTLSVPDGESIAHKTLNARLGILGGISILGTQGTVIPYSHEAWQAVIVQGLHVARALNSPLVCFSTGRRSERLLMERYPQLPEYAFVQAADYAAFSLRAARDAGFQQLVWACFFGKLVKLAQGLENTHARSAPLDMAFLAHQCYESGVQRSTVKAIAQCITAGHALECISTDAQAKTVLQALAHKAQKNAQAFAGFQCTVTIHLFHLNGTELATA